MTKVVYTEGFVSDAASVELDAKLQEVRETTELLATLPTLGSRDFPLSICEAFGDDVRKLNVHPFLVIYRYSESDDIVHILGAGLGASLSYPTRWLARKPGVE